MYSVANTPYGVGFPIRTFLGQSILAAHQNLSQRVTSFIASLCQGIHQMLLSYLILIRSQTFFIEPPICLPFTSRVGQFSLAIELTYLVPTSSEDVVLSVSPTEPVYNTSDCLVRTSATNVIGKDHKNQRKQNAFNLISNIVITTTR